MAKIATDSIKEITKKDKDAKKAGEDLIFTYAEDTGVYRVCRQKEGMR
jgi:hypothetical protein